VCVCRWCLCGSGRLCVFSMGTTFAFTLEYWLFFPLHRVGPFPSSHSIHSMRSIHSKFPSLSLCLSHCIRSLLYFSWSLMSCVFYQVIGVMAPCLLLSACIGGGGAVLLVQSTRFAI